MHKAASAFFYRLTVPLKKAPVFCNPLCFMYCKQLYESMAAVFIAVFAYPAAMFNLIRRINAA